MSFLSALQEEVSQLDCRLGEEPLSITPAASLASGLLHFVHFNPCIQQGQESSFQIPLLPPPMSPLSLLALHTFLSCFQDTNQTLKPLLL